MKDKLRIFYMAYLIILGESDMVPARRYEDDKIEIALKRTVFSNDTIVIWLKGLGGMRVYEATVCPSIILSQTADQIYLRGNWEKYLEGLFKNRNKKIKNKKDFETWVVDVGAIDDDIRTGEVDDLALFENDIAQG